ncbi:MAG: nicotinate-nucleotide--dimethylbenzimidazole phosphoribosyltransferase [Rhodospirillales bacterium]
MTQPMHCKSLDAFRRLLSAAPQASFEAREAAERRQAQLIKPAGALGRLEWLAAWVASWQGADRPRAERVRVVVFAGSHGIAARGVSLYPASVTRQMVACFHQGHAAINQLCRTIGADLEIVPLDVDKPTADILDAPAMTEEEFLTALNAGLAAVGAEDVDLLCLGEMGIGNTTAAAALSHALFGGTAGAWTGAGTGIDSTRREAKVGIVAEAAARHRAEASDGLDLLRRLGGRELAAIAGAVVGARHRRVPVVLDGYTTTAAAASLAFLRSDALAHCLVGHLSVEPGHRLLVEMLDLVPLLDLGMRLGEASGAAVAAGIVRAAVACHTGMATFAEVGVDGAEGNG